MHAQGLGLRIRHADLLTERLPQSLTGVLTEPSFASAARNLQVKLRARPRTPTQEAGGVQISLPPLWSLRLIEEKTQISCFSKAAAVMHTISS